MRNLRFVLVFGLLLVLSSCQTKEQKIEDAKEVVSSFIAATSSGNKNLVNEIYPDFDNIQSNLTFNDYHIESATLEDDVVTIAIGNGKKDIFFLLKKENYGYIIFKSIGATAYYGSDLFHFCLKIGCLDGRIYDDEIAEVCLQNEPEFNRAALKVTEELEKSIVLRENHVNNFNGLLASGHIVVENESDFTFPSSDFSYRLDFSDNQGNYLFSKYIKPSDFDFMPRSRVEIIVLENVERGFDNISLEVGFNNYEYAFGFVARYAKGGNCKYANNL